MRCAFSRSCRALDHLVAAALVQPAVARIRALLRVAVADRERGDAAAALVDRLRDPRAGRAVELLVGPPEVHPGPADAHARRGVQRALRVEQQRDALAQRHRGGIALERRRVAVDVRVGRRLGDAVLRHRGARFGDRGRARGSGGQTGVAEVVAGREPPGAAVERADAVAGARRVGQGGDHAVAHLDPLGPPALEADVGIARAARRGRVQRALRRALEGQIIGHTDRLPRTESRTTARSPAAPARTKGGLCSCRFPRAALRGAVPCTSPPHRTHRESAHGNRHRSHGEHLSFFGLRPVLRRPGAQLSGRRPAHAGDPAAGLPADRLGHGHRLDLGPGAAALRAW